MSKTLIWFGFFVGSSLGAFLPCLFGAASLSLWGLLGSVVGGSAGIFAGFKLSEMLGV